VVPINAQVVFEHDHRRVLFAVAVVFFQVSHAFQYAKITQLNTLAATRLKLCTSFFEGASLSGSSQGKTSMRFGPRSYLWYEIADRSARGR